MKKVYIIKLLCADGSSYHFELVYTCKHDAQVAAQAVLMQDRFITDFRIVERQLVEEGEER